MTETMGDNIKFGFALLLLAAGVVGFLRDLARALQLRVSLSRGSDFLTSRASQSTKLEKLFGRLGKRHFKQQVLYFYLCS